MMEAVGDSRNCIVFISVLANYVSIFCIISPEEIVILSLMGCNKADLTLHKILESKYATQLLSADLYLFFVIRKLNHKTDCLVDGGGALYFFGHSYIPVCI